MLSRDSVLARGLEPLAAALWTLFVLVSLLVAIVWAFGIGEGSLENRIGNQDLLHASNWMLGQLDFVWITLAAANAYAGVATNEGLASARRWALWVILGVVILAWASSKSFGPVESGNPLGSIRYSSRLGPKFGPIPVGLPLLWLAILFGARDAVLWWLPRLSQLRVAFATSALVAFTDFSLEPLAAGVRGFWFWQTAPGLPPSFDPPALNWLEWGVIAGLLAYCLRNDCVATGSRPKSWKPAATLAVIHTVFLAAHIGRWTRV